MILTPHMALSNASNPRFLTSNRGSTSWVQKLSCVCESNFSTPQRYFSYRGFGGCEDGLLSNIVVIVYVRGRVVNRCWLFHYFIEKG